MHYIIVVPGNAPLHRCCALKGDSISDLIKSLSFFKDTHTIAWIANSYPLFTFTLVKDTP